MSIDRSADGVLPVDESSECSLSSFLGGVESHDGTSHTTGSAAEAERSPRGEWVDDGASRGGVATPAADLARPGRASPGARPGAAAAQRDATACASSAQRTGAGRVTADARATSARAPSPSVLITGAAGGIGRALVERFSAAGWRVIATERTGGDVPLDVTDEASVLAARERVGVPDVIINNAGLGLLGPMVELPDDVLARQLDVNVRGPARVVRAFAPGMCRRGSGRIINVGSLAGVFTLPWFGAYGATKHAVEAMSDALRLELAPFGVQVSLVEPSVVGTAFLDAAVASLTRAAHGSQWHDSLQRTLAVKDRVAAVTVTPEQVADAVFHAATARRPRARYRVGRLASALLRFASVLPVSWLDALLRALAGLDARRAALPSTHAAESPR